MVFAAVGGDREIAGVKMMMMMMMVMVMYLVRRRALGRRWV